MKIAVVGGGRMGLPLACTFGKHGASVIVCDTNSELVEKLNNGICPYEEPDLPELISDLHNNNKLTATISTAKAVSDCNVIVVIVPAHLTTERDIDFSILQSASTEIGKGLQPNTLVIYETTVAVGGTRRSLIPYLEQNSGLKAGKDFYVAYSPERVKANLVLSRLETTPKVVGGYDTESCNRAIEFYKKYLNAPVDNVGTIEAAEMTKLVGMLYRDVNIALSNELAAFCEIAGIDFDKVSRAANTDGEANLLLPGIGVGGHCVPVYPYFVTRESRRLGLTQRLSEAAREINDNQPLRQIHRIEKLWSNLKGIKVHILGLGFRPGVKVETFSSSYSLRDELAQLGALVSIEDPYYKNDELQQFGFIPGKIEDSKVVILSTAHEEFFNPDFKAWSNAGVEAVLDGRNLWNQQNAEAAGLLYFGIGRSAINEQIK
jgi:nucleotide sugar dehydrogenase